MWGGGDYGWLEKFKGKRNLFNYFAFLGTAADQSSFVAEVPQTMSNRFFSILTSFRTGPGQSRTFGYAPKLCDISKRVLCNSEYCNKKGTCHEMPYTEVKWCKCFRGFMGKTCKEKQKIEKVNEIMNMVVTIPQLSDVYFGIEDMREFMAAQALNVKELLKSLESKLKNSVIELQKNMGNQMAFTRLVSKYYRDVSALNHLLDIRQNQNKEFSYISDKEWSGLVLKKGKISKLLKQYHKMMTGKDKVFGGEPFLVEMMKIR